MSVQVTNKSSPIVSMIGKPLRLEALVLATTVVSINDPAALKRETVS